LWVEQHLSYKISEISEHQILFLVGFGFEKKKKKKKKFFFFFCFRKEKISISTAV